jgi:hypothetical protein
MIRVERENRTAIWNFGLQRGNFSIRLGIGGGKVWRLEGGTTLNLFVEPQVAVTHDGCCA